MELGRMYLYSLVVDHRVDSNSGSLVICSICLLPELGPPRRGHDGEDRVGCHGCTCDESELPAVLVG